MLQITSNSKSNESLGIVFSIIKSIDLILSDQLSQNTRVVRDTNAATSVEHAKATYIKKSTDCGRTTEHCPLESATSHVAASAGSGREGDGRSKTFAATFTSLCEWAQANSLIQNHSDVSFLCRPPDGKGDEHEAWFDEATNRWFKATYPNRFGLGWSCAGESANALEYLTRLGLQNKFFGDNIRLEAVVNCDEKMRVLTSQPHIEGEAAPYNEIQAWFVANDFVKIESEGCIAWYKKEENILVADAHEGNVIKTPEGILVPIDLNIIQPKGATFDWIMNALEATKK